MDYVLPIACPKCGSPAGTVGYAEESGPQLIGRCPKGHYVKCVPKTESGRKVRTVKTTHEAISTKQRMRIVLRANGRCETCGRSGEIQVGHIISVENGHARGLTDAEINSDENLCAMCPECNLGLGKETLPLRVFVNILMARVRARTSDGSDSGRCPFDPEGEASVDSLEGGKAERRTDKAPVSGQRPDGEVERLDDVDFF